MNKKAFAAVTMIALLGLLIPGCGTPAPESTSTPPSATAMPTQLSATPTRTPEAIEAKYTNAAWGLSMWYPEDWVYEEGESQVNFASSEQLLTGEEAETAAWIAVDPLGPAGQGSLTIDLEMVCWMILDSFAEADRDRWDISDPQPRRIGGRDGCEMTFEDRQDNIRGFVAGAANAGWGYFFYAGSPVDEWPERGPDLETMLDSVQFTTPPTPTPAPIPTATPTVPSGPIATPHALAGTPVPRPEAAISPENAQQVAQLARWGKEGTAAVESVAFSPDGRTVASGSSDGTVGLCRVSDGELLQTMEGNTSGVGAVAFSLDGQTVASRSGATVRLWRVSDGELMRTLDVDVDPPGVFVASSVALSPDWQVLASGTSGGPVQLWRVTNGELLQTLSGHMGTVTSVAFSGDGQILASASSSGGVQLRRASDGDPLRTLDVTGLGIVSHVVFSPGGDTLAAAGGHGALQLWRVTDGALLQTLEGHAELVNSLAFSPDGQILASGSSDDTVRLWRVSDGALLHTLRGHTDSVSDVAFSPDGAMLASGSLDGTIRLWGVPAE